MNVNEFITQNSNNFIIKYKNKLYGFNTKSIKKIHLFTFNNKTLYFNIGAFFNKNFLIDFKQFSGFLKKNKKIIEIRNIKSKGNKYILHDSFYDPCKLIKSKLYENINNFLIDKTFTGDKFSINKEIKKLDKAFIETAIRNEDNTFYCSINNTKLKNIGDEVYIKHFIKCSKSNVKKTYKVIFNLPYLPLNTTEKHILLPRNILLQVISKDKEYILLAKEKKINQFKATKEFSIKADVYMIESYNLSLVTDKKLSILTKQYLVGAAPTPLGTAAKSILVTKPLLPERVSVSPSKVSVSQSQSRGSQSPSSQSQSQSRGSQSPSSQSQPVSRRQRPVENPVSRRQRTEASVATPEENPFEQPLDAETHQNQLSLMLKERKAAEEAEEKRKAAEEAEAAEEEADRRRVEGMRKLYEEQRNENRKARKDKDMVYAEAKKKELEEEEEAKKKKVEEEEKRIEEEEEVERKAKAKEEDRKEKVRNQREMTFHNKLKSIENYLDPKSVFTDILGAAEIERRQLLQKERRESGADEAEIKMQKLLQDERRRANENATMSWRAEKKIEEAIEEDARVDLKNPRTIPRSAYTSIKALELMPDPHPNPVPATQARSILDWNYSMHFNILLQEIERLLPYLIAKREAIILQLEKIKKASNLDDLKISLRQKSLQLLHKITEFNASYTRFNKIYISNENLTDQEVNCRLHYTTLTTLQTDILSFITDDSEKKLYNTQDIDSSNYTHYKRYDKLQYTDLEITYRNTKKEDISLNSSKIYNAIIKDKQYTYFKVTTSVSSKVVNTQSIIFFIEKKDETLKSVSSKKILDKYTILTQLYIQSASDNPTEMVAVYPTTVTLSGANVNEENNKYIQTVIVGGLNKSKTPKKEILGKIRCIYKVPGSRKEHVKHNGQLISVSDYKKLMKQR